MSIILQITLPVLTAIVGWFTGRRKQNNDFLNDLQKSVNMLTDRNAQLLQELIKVRGENATLLSNQTEMKIEMEQLRRQNRQLQEEIELLNEKLSNVKTITRKG